MVTENKYQPNKHYKTKLSGYSINNKINSGESFLWETFTKYDDLKKGDLVVFENRNGGLTMHELREKQGKNWTTQGNNNKHRDPIVVGPMRYRGKFKQKVEK